MKSAKKKIRGTIFLFSLIFLFFGGVSYIFLGKAESRWDRENGKTVMVSDGGMEFIFSDVAERTIGDFLATQKLNLKEGDSVFPSEDAPLYSGTHIWITRAREVVVKVDGGEKRFRTQMPTVGQALAESGVSLGEDDIVKPDREAPVTEGLHVAVTRVEISEETVEKPVAFDKKTNEDDKLSWRKTVVTQKGENGTERLTYRVSRHDGKEVNRRLLKKETIKEPVTEIVTQGTYVKTGKAHRGAASWYAWTGTMAAAHKTLPKGSYVKVTNMDNGKSVIVVINDRGPYVPGRIIDLDKAAFAKIASIGAGVINVKMEEITN